jgi:hypothetical protein
MPIAYGTVIMLDVEAVKLEDEVSLRNESLVHGATMITHAAEQLPVPSAACFDIGDGN